MPVPVELLTIDTLNECAHLLAARKKTLGSAGDGSVLYDWCLDNGVEKLAPEIVLDSPGRHPIGHKMHQYMVWESYVVFIHVMNNLQKRYMMQDDIHDALRDTLYAVSLWFENPHQEPHQLRGNWNTSEPLVTCDVMRCVLSPPSNGGMKARWPFFWAQQILLFAQNQNDRRYQIRQRYRLLYAMGETNLPDMTDMPPNLRGDPTSTFSSYNSFGYEVRTEIRRDQARESFVAARTGTP